jgi:hypothetical protein
VKPLLLLSFPNELVLKFQFGIIMIEYRIRTTPIQKLLIVASALTFIALSCLTASLPLNLPSLQGSESTTGPGTENIVTGDTVWLLVCAVVSFILTPTIGSLYGAGYVGIVFACHCIEPAFRCFTLFVFDSHLLYLV